MSIPLKVRVATANCGNDGPGLIVLQKIKQLIEKDDLDCFILSGQELNFRVFTSRFYHLFSDSQYRLIELGKMHTHTKLPHLFDRHTGMGCYVIAKKDIEIEIQDIICSRRSTKLHCSDKFNKGGLVTKFKIRQKGGSYECHHISGHLDSRYRDRATYDWYKLYKNYACDRIRAWDELVAIIPDLLSCGMDANTRNVITKKGIINPWIEKHVNTKGMRIAPLGNHFFSAIDTYRSYLKKTKTKEDPKRKGFVPAGALDVVAVSDPFVKPDVFELYHDDCIAISCYPEISKRDHNIIISPMYPISAKNEFNRVKYFLSAQLKNFSVDLSNLLMNMADSPQSRQQFVDCYNSYLSKSGLLCQLVKKHSHELGSGGKVKSSFLG